MSKKRIIAYIFCFLTTSSIMVNSAEIKTTPEIPVWVADGVTEYRLFVWVENTGLGGEPTDGIDWCLNNIAGFTYVNGSVVAPSINDFYCRMAMFFEVLAPPGGLCCRIVEKIGGGPIDGSGNVGEYRFTVLQSFRPDEYTFTLTDTGLYSQEGEGQPHTISNNPITVVPKVKPDFNSDGYVNNEDYVIFEYCLFGPDVIVPIGCEDADLDNDGDVDLEDFSSFQRCFTGDNPVGDPNCLE